MKAQSIGKKYNKGMSTLEILIAFAVVILCVSAVILVVFSNQSIAVDTQTNIEAISKAKALLEEARADSREDFNSISEVEPDPLEFYKSGLKIFDISPCAKNLTSAVNWGDYRPQGVELSTIVTNPFLGVYCDPTPPASSWEAPTAYNVLSPSDFDGKGTGIAISFVNGIPYAFLTTDSNTPGKDDFWVIDISDPENITSDDISSARIGEKGLSGITVVGNYAYVLHNDITNHLMMVDITDPLNPIKIIGATVTLQGLTNGKARSIFYYDKKLYIGTDFVSPSLNNEFHIIDLPSPTSPSWQTSIKINRNVNYIAVRDGLAYLATGSGSTSPYTPLKIFDVDPDSSNYLEKIDEFENLINWHGTAVYILGNKINNPVPRAQGI